MSSRVGSNVRTAPLRPFLLTTYLPVVDSVHRWGSKGGLRPPGIRPLIYPPHLTAPVFRSVEGRGVKRGRFPLG